MPAASGERASERDTSGLGEELALELAAVRLSHAKQIKQLQSELRKAHSAARRGGSAEAAALQARGASFPAGTGRAIDRAGQGGSAVNQRAETRRCRPWNPPTKLAGPDARRLRARGQIVRTGVGYAR
eukprot:468134-Pleurochrysis_carterae.AAC.1